MQTLKLEDIFNRFLFGGALWDISKRKYEPVHWRNQTASVQMYATTHGHVQLQPEAKEFSL